MIYEIGFSIRYLFRSGKVFKDISFAYDRDHHFVHECFGKIRELMGRPYEIKCDNHEGLEGEIRETFTHKVPVEYYAMRQSGGYCDRRHKSIYLRKTDETENKKKEYFVSLDNHIEFEVTVSIKAKARYNSEKTIEVSEEELSL